MGGTRGREGEREKEREGGREEGRERGKEGERKGGREKRKERGKEGERKERMGGEGIGDGTKRNGRRRGMGGEFPVTILPSLYDLLHAHDGDVGALRYFRRVYRLATSHVGYVFHGRSPTQQLLQG